MATLQWNNQSNQMVKWLVIVNGQLQGNGIDPGQSYQMDDAGVTWAGWSLGGAGFAGYTLAQNPPPAGYAGVFFATNPFSEGEDVSSILKAPPTASGD
ncbi:MAG: hypothetical protein ICV60_24360 [Pyrinomonadaceae bacterium]|nr:hypothetical protein [Pyrinomonadaceae bacterium]